MKKIKILLRKDQNQWLATVSGLPNSNSEIKQYGNNRKRALRAAKIKALKELVAFYESHDCELNGIAFNIINLSVPGNLYRAIRKILIKCWINTHNWIIRLPFLSFISRILFHNCVYFLAFILLGFAVTTGVLINSLFQEKQVVATLWASLLAFFGVLITITLQGLMAIYKNKMDRKNENLKKISADYEKVIKLLKKPSKFNLEEVVEFVNQFSNKVEIYGSSNILYRWNEIKRKAIEVQHKTSEISLKDLKKFRDFIWEIRQESGHSSNYLVNQRYLLIELENLYKK